MSKSVQDYIPIKEIRDGVVILKTGEIRSVVLVSSINFELKGHDEQLAILSGYQNFLNSLDFSIQLFVQSRKLDIRPYINVLEAREREQLNDLIKIQTREYIEYIKAITEQTNVMSKTFFVVVPYSPIHIGSGAKSGIFSSLFSKKSASESGRGELEQFQNDRSQLEQRKTVVMQGLARIGIRSQVLDTEALVELYYKMFNPGDVNMPPTGSVK